MMIGRLIFIILAATLVFQTGCSYKSPVPVDLPELEMDDYTKGLLAGELFALGNDAWVLNGCILPFFAVVHARIHKPTPPEYVRQFLLDKSQDYVRGFTEAYQSKSRIKNANKALGGSIIGSGIVIGVGSFLLAMMHPNT